MNSFRSYEGAARFLSLVTDYEKERSRYGPREYNLHAMRRILARLGDPQRAFGSIHIAGTKGKGSTAMMAESLLRGTGAKTGLFVSPHLVDTLERIQINGRPISRPKFVEVMNRIRPALAGVRPTYFEIMTAAGFEAFRRGRVDRAVVEVGLGGRLDTTNVLRPVVCVITTIDFDHMDKLGNTLSKIAGEKAGILKAGVPCIVAPQVPAAMRVIERRAREIGASLVRVGREVRVSCRAGRGLEVRVAFAGKKHEFTMPFLGRHQAANAAAAIAAAELAWGRPGPEVTRSVFESLRLPGRFERVGRRVLLDVAHNPVSARALAAALAHIGWRGVTVVFGCSRDKDARAMLRTLAPFAGRFILTQAASPRAAPAAELARWVRNGEVIPDVRAAVGEALRGGGKVLVTGSFYVAGEALERIGNSSRMQS
ncbi:MAG TPA: Mur ligase family protein [Planctomycetota bacterium]|nr:Mur ligase family protein [Planctomycetota bacterium]